MSLPFNPVSMRLLSLLGAVCFVEALVESMVTVGLRQSLQTSGYSYVVESPCKSLILSQGELGFVNLGLTQPCIASF